MWACPYTPSPPLSREPTVQGGHARWGAATGALDFVENVSVVLPPRDHLGNGIVVPAATSLRTHPISIQRGRNRTVEMAYRERK